MNKYSDKPTKVFRRYVKIENPLGGFDVKLANPMRHKANGAHVLAKFNKESEIDYPLIGASEDKADMVRSLLNGLPFPVTA